MMTIEAYQNAFDYGQRSLYHSCVGHKDLSSVQFYVGAPECQWYDGW